MLPYVLWPVFFTPFFIGEVHFADYTLTSILKNMILTIAEYKGLWFLIVFWALSLIGYLMRSTGNRFCRDSTKLIMEGTVLCLLLSCFFILSKWSSYELWRQIIAYFTFFFIGVYMSRFQALQRITMNKVIYSICWVVFLVSASQFTGSNLIYRIIGGLASLPVFFCLAQVVKLPRIIKNYLLTLGHYSLAIYIVHWYFLTIYTDTPLLANFSQWWIGLISTVIACVIAYICILFAKLMETIPLLNFLLFGKKARRKYA